MWSRDGRAQAADGGCEVEQDGGVGGAGVVWLVGGGRARTSSTHKNRFIARVDDVIIIFAPWELDNRPKQESRTTEQGCGSARGHDGGGGEKKRAAHPRPHPLALPLLTLCAPRSSPFLPPRGRYSIRNVLESYFQPCLRSSDQDFSCLEGRKRRGKKKEYDA